MTITIDGKACECEKGEFILHIARRNCIEIPTLCHHESLAGQGSCRLCIVEVIERGQGKIVTSCVYPVERECEVLTNSEKVRTQRGVILALLRDLAPDSDVIADLCRKYDAPAMPRLTALAAGKCILCGLCARACTELGAGAISTINRGVTKEVSTPYGEPNPVCIGCGSCAHVCPTGAIDMTETADTREIWGKKFELVKCSRCGAVIGTKQEIAYASWKSGEEEAALCAACRKKELSVTFMRTYGRD